MGVRTIGIAVSGPDPVAALSQIREAEELGIGAAWSTSGGTGGDPLTLFAAAAAQTERILLGTSIVQTWSRHPVAMAHQVQVIAGLAPGRFRLGVGPGHRRGMERTFGADFRAPLGHLREYIRVLKQLLQSGEVDFDGRYYTAHAKIPAPIEVPVMASALRPSSFELCGAEADGAISWVCPYEYLRDVALPAMAEGAEQAGRPTPPLVVHAPVCVDDDVAEVREAACEQLGGFPSTPFYAAMFDAAGFPGSAETGWTDEMVDSVVISGDDAAVAERLERVFSWGASEVLATVITAGEAGRRSSDRTMKFLAQVSSS